MDTMWIRRQGVPENRLRMKFVMLIMRLCLAAYFSDKNAETVLGPSGHVLKDLIRITRTKSLILHIFIRNADNIIGIGGQYIVMESTIKPGCIEKYSYTLAGTDRTVLAKTVLSYEAEHERMQRQFGGLTLPTEYAVAIIPLRGFLGHMATICARQPHLKDVTDIFTPEADELIRTVGSDLKHAVATLAACTRQWIQHDTWLDLIGPNNIVISTAGNQPSINIIDTEPYVPSYLDETNPVLGKSYKDVFFERLQTLESYSKYIPLITLVVMGTLLLRFSVNVLPLHTLFSQLDVIEDALENAHILI